MPFRVRYFYRISVFSYKVLNRHFLRQIEAKIEWEEKSATGRLRSREPELTIVPKCNKNSGFRRLSVFLPRFVNLITREALRLPFLEFKKAMFSDLILNFEKFSRHF